MGVSISKKVLAAWVIGLVGFALTAVGMNEGSFIWLIGLPMMFGAIYWLGYRTVKSYESKPKA